MAVKKASSSVALAALREALISEGYPPQDVDVWLYAVTKKVNNG